MTENESPKIEISATPLPNAKKPLNKRYTLIKFLYKAVLIFLGYAISYMQWHFTLLFVAAGSLIWLENLDNSHSSKIKAKSTACSFNHHDVLRKIDEIPSWVKFPDRERAEWLNQIIVQLWPTVNSYVVKVFRTSIQTKIRKKYDAFQFESIDLGQRPPKIDGVKVYKTVSTKDSIIIDCDVFYDGDCDINFSLSGAEIGGLRDFQLSVELRIVLKPLLSKMPLVGGIQLYFLNTPDISFTLDGLTSIPGLSSFLRSKIEENISKKIVFPNKITKRFSKSVAPFELRALEPAGVLRVHVFEAKDLMGKDLSGKSDPYVILHVGAQQRRTNVVNQNLNPKWDYWCEFIIVDPLTQHLDFKLFDKDNVNEDDPLGGGEVDIRTVLKGDRDQWVKLVNAKHGSIHLRFTWLSLSSNVEDLQAIREETELLKVHTISRAVLVVYIEMAKNLPCAKHLIKPHPYITLKIGDQKEKSKIKKHTNDPAWEQGFVLLVPKPREDLLHMAVMDKSTGNLLNEFSYQISELIDEPNLEISKREFVMKKEDSKLVLSLQLRILTNQLFEMEDEESETDSDEPSSIDATSLRSRSSFRISPPFKDVEDQIIPSTAPTVSNMVRHDSLQMTNSSGEFNLGRIEISLNYNEPRQKLLLTVHRVLNLPLKDPSDIPDPYVRVRMMSKGQNGSTHRTKVVMDNCSPVYNETFEYSFSLADAYEQTVVVTVKTKKFLHNNTMGQAEIILRYVDLSEPYRNWFDLRPK